MRQVLHPFFALLASLTLQELARQIVYLKEENRILRSKLPKQISVTARERDRLVKVGRKLGAQIKELISIVTYGSFLRWVRHSPRSAARRKVRRGSRAAPRTPDEIRVLILKLARENEWGYTSILGALRKLRIKKVSRQTVKNILKENGLEPSPERSKGTWDEFFSSHAQTLWQCDFATKRMRTIRGFVDLYFLVFIHIGTRRCRISPCTQHPESACCCQQARNFLMHAEDVELSPKFVMRDNDAKCTEALISIVCSGAFLRWLRIATNASPAKKASTRKPGRPRTPDTIKELVLKLARENDWGYTLRYAPSPDSTPHSRRVLSFDNGREMCRGQHS